MIKRLFKTITFAVFAFSLLGSAFAAPEINTLEKSGLLGKFKPTDTAIRGYDPVAYFTEGKPIAGTQEHTVQWSGATWQFASDEHKQLFEADPEKYAPQYGGYCAYGVAGGYLVKIEPENFSIIDGKLYLNYNDGVQEKWEADIPEFIKEADQKFDGLLEDG